MGYKPKKGGYIHNARIARGKSAAKEQRTIIEQIIRRGPTRTELYQLLAQLSLLSSKIDEALDDLSEFK